MLDLMTIIQLRAHLFWRKYRKHLMIMSLKRFSTALSLSFGERTWLITIFKM